MLHSINEVSINCKILRDLFEILVYDSILQDEGLLECHSQDIIN